MAWLSRLQPVHELRAKFEHHAGTASRIACISKPELVSTEYPLTPLWEYPGQYQPRSLWQHGGSPVAWNFVDPGM